MTHRTDIEGFKSVADLAEAVGNLRYDALRDFFKALEAKMKKDAKADDRRGRERLAYRLDLTSCCLHDAACEVDEAWDICEPYMKDKP